MKINELKLSKWVRVRICNALRSLDIHTVEDFLAWDPVEVMDRTNLGKISMNEINRAVDDEIKRSIDITDKIILI